MISTTLQTWLDDPPPTVRWSLFGVGAASLMAAVLLGLWRPDAFFRSYLTAYLGWLAVPLGCLALTMLHHLTGGRWGWALRRALSASTRTLFLLGLFFLPLLFGLSRLYPWVRWEETTHDAVLEAKRFYLNVPFFLVRAAVYFAGWLGIGYLLNRWSSDQATLQRRLRLLSAPGLVFFGLSVTFASIDWAMSLEPHWFSTIYGVLFATGQILAALAFAVLVTAILAQRWPIEPDVLRDLGNLLLAFTMLWAYLQFSQFLLIWAGNLPEEVTWYLRRLEGSRQWLALALVVFQFVLPFLLLLSAPLKRDARTLAAVAALILIMRFFDMWWTVIPAPPASDWLATILNLTLVVGLGGIWLGTFSLQFQRQRRAQSDER